MNENDETNPVGKDLIIDAKDIVLHLRSIHFSLLVACVGLFVLVTAGRPEEIDLAQAQLSEIVALSKAWQPDWVESAASDLRGKPRPFETPNQRGAGPVRLDIDRSWTLLPLQQELLELAHPSAAPGPLDRNGPLWSELASPERRDRQFAPLQQTEFQPKIAPLLLAAPQTLKEFETIWNVLGRITLTVTEATSIFPETMGPSESRLGTWPYSEAPPADGIRVSMRLEPIANPQQELIWRDRVDHEWRPEYQFVGHIDMAANGIAKLLPNPTRPQGAVLPINPTPFGALRPSEPATISMVTPVEISTFDAQSAFIDYFGLEWLPGSYALNFPELSAVAAGNDDLYFDKVTAFIESKARQSEGEVAIFGLAIPVAKVSSWGAPIVLVMQIYFLLHLRSLLQRLYKGGEPKLAPWIGVYGDRFARVISGTSVMVMPPATLYVVTAPEAAARPILAVGVVTSGLLGLISFWVLREVWKTLGNRT
ncbi:hypothetical protein [Sedimentitalea todarodis]|uniref:Uncharacterized protein n=1 Tax=Sedimentitalea todarodis TaxID=1631240 RepID=A0ABU3VL80_9RHOB|nr:hypothetical protein [Sedimentitalea todarodis]MDU9006931.1 hypothetical protein [Sedimentitalea todarodis]